MTVVALVQRRGDLSSIELLGKKVWQRAARAAQGVRGGRLVWLGSRPENTGDGLDSARPAELASLPGPVLLLAADAPCVSPRSLRRLLKLAVRGPYALGREGEPIALAATGRKLASALSAGRVVALGVLAGRLGVGNVAPSQDEDELLRVRSAETFSRAARALRRRKVEALLRLGVWMSDPDTVLVDPEARVSKGARLEPWVVIEGASRIGARSVVGSFSHIVDSTIGADTLLLDHCFVRSSRIGRGARLGPFAHLRPDSNVGAAARIGNFVELKKTRLREGAKAPHLSYLGDADVGKGVNVGAGTITCNYDGRVKQRTIVGDGAFIGSDVQLVAPVRVGKGAYVAAGSCIVEDVPPHALALARSRQIVKKGWAKKRARGKKGR